MHIKNKRLFNLFKHFNFQVVVIYLILSYVVFQQNILNSLSNVIINYLDMSYYKFSFFSSLYFLFDLLLVIPMGIFFDSYQHKVIFLISLVISLVGLLIFILYPTPYTYSIWRIMLGIFAASGFIGCFRTVLYYADKSKVGLFVGITGVVIMSSSLLSQLPVVALVKYIGLKHFLLLDMMMGTLLLFIIVVIMDVIKITESRSKTSLKWKVINAKNVLLAVYAGLINLPIILLGALWGDLYLMHRYNMKAEAASTVISMIFIGNLFGAFLFGFLYDRLVKKYLLLSYSGIFLVLSFSLLNFLKIDSVVSLNLIFLLIGITTGSQAVCYAEVRKLNAKNDIGKGVSIISFTSMLTGILAQNIFSIILRDSHNYDFNFISLFFLGIGVTIIFVTLLLMRSRVCTQSINQQNTLAR